MVSPRLLINWRKTIKTSHKRHATDAAGSKTNCPFTPSEAKPTKPTRFQQQGVAHASCRAPLLFYCRDFGAALTAWGCPYGRGVPPRAQPRRPLPGAGSSAASAVSRQRPRRRAEHHGRCSSGGGEERPRGWGGLQAAAAVSRANGCGAGGTRWRCSHHALEGVLCGFGAFVFKRKIPFRQPFQKISGKPT